MPRDVHSDLLNLYNFVSFVSELIIYLYNIYQLADKF